MTDTDRAEWKTIAVLIAGILLAPVMGLIVAWVAIAQDSPQIGAILGGGVLLLLTLAVLFVAYLYRPRLPGSGRVWLYMLSVLSAAFAAAASLQPLREMFVRWVIDVVRGFGVDVFPRLPPDQDLFPYFIVLCVTVAILALAWVWLHRPTITPRPTGPPPDTALRSTNNDRDIPEALRRYCGSLRDYLNGYDREVNWSDRDYIPLEAEIEAEWAGQLRPKVMANLVEAIRRDRYSRTFVVIGDPGSGKSVSLRNLVRNLLAEAERSGVVPVYVNLREFPAGKSIGIDELVQFARECVREQTGRDGEAFLNGWYEQFRQSGRLFFIFDSFDELPQVLDADDRSDTHQQVCRAFDRLFTQEVRSCRAVLASRPFRAPSGVQGTRLVVRPLTEAQVRRVVAARVLGRGFDPNEFVRRVFRDRPELVPLLRNPFTAELLTDYARDRNGELPASAYDIFNTYVTTRLKADEPKLSERFGLTADDLRRAARLLAMALYEGDRGLEADASWAAAQLDVQTAGHGKSLIEGLKYTRLARVGGHGRTVFTFAHRRFAEFFAVDAMLAENRSPPLEHIPTDSRWRDGLVMYCGVAPVAERERVANFCWEQIDGQADGLKAGRLAEAGKAIHCLRFLVDAFRSDAIAVGGFQMALGMLIRTLLKSKDPLVAKLAAEAIPLADEHGKQRALLRAMGSRFNWVQEAAVGACRNLPRLGDKTAQAVRGFFRAMPTWEKMKRFGELSFSLSLSEAFRPLRRALWGDMVEVAGLFTLSIVATAWVSAIWGYFGFLLLVLATFSIALFGAIFLVPFKNRKFRYSRTIRGITAPALLLDPIRMVVWSFGTGLLFMMLMLPMVVELKFFDLSDGAAVAWRLLLLLVGVALFFTSTFGWESYITSAGRLFLLQRGLKFATFFRRDWKILVAVFAVVASFVVAVWFLAQVSHIVVWVWGVVMAGFVIAKVGAFAWDMAQKTWQRYCDRDVIAHGLPDRVTAEQVFTTLLELRSTFGRREYLQGLLARRVPLVFPGGHSSELSSALPDPPAEVVAVFETQSDVAEDWAKLREFWFGLSR